IDPEDAVDRPVAVDRIDEARDVYNRATLPDECARNVQCRPAHADGLTGRLCGDGGALRVAWQRPEIDWRVRGVVLPKDGVNRSVCRAAQADCLTEIVDARGNGPICAIKRRQRDDRMLCVVVPEGAALPEERARYPANGLAQLVRPECNRTVRSGI